MVLIQIPSWNNFSHSSIRELASLLSSMANRIYVNVFWVYPLTTLNIAFTKTSGEIPLTLVDKQGNTNEAKDSLLQISIMLLNVFCKNFPSFSSSVFEGTIIRKLTLNYWELDLIQTIETRVQKPYYFGLIHLLR